MERLAIGAAALAAALAWFGTTAWFGGTPAPGTASYPVPEAEAVAGRLSEGAAALADFGSLATMGAMAFTAPEGVALDRPAAGYWWSGGGAALAVETVDAEAFFGWAAALGNGDSSDRIRIDGALAQRFGDVLAAERGGQGWIATDWRALRHVMAAPAPVAPPEGLTGTTADGLRFAASRRERGWTIEVMRHRDGDDGGGIPAGLFFPEEEVHGAVAMTLDGGRKARLLAVFGDLARQTGDAATAAAAAELASLVEGEFSAAAFTGADGRWGYAAAFGVADEGAAGDWVRERFGMESENEEGPTAYLGVPLWTAVADGRLWVSSDDGFLSRWRARTETGAGGETGGGGAVDQGFVDGAAMPYAAAPLRHGAGPWAVLGRVMSGLDRLAWRGERWAGEERITIEADLAPDSAPGRGAP